MGVDWLKLAAKAVASISAGDGKRLEKKYAKPREENNAPIYMKGERFTGGFASAEVMPASVTSRFFAIAGFGTGRAVEGVHDPLTVSALWLGCGDGGVVFVAADCIGLTNTTVREIRRALAVFSAKSGCRSINICCSHTHAGFDTVGYWGKLPKTGLDSEYMALLREKIVQTVIRAYEGRTEGRLYVGTAQVPDGQYIRYEPRVYHNVLTRLRFVPDDGTDETWFVNFAAHANTLGGANRQISADYPYYLREAIREKRPVHVMFGAGAIGAVDPGYHSEDRAERTRIQGEKLAEAALGIAKERELPAEVTVLCRPVYLPADNGVLDFLSLFHVMGCDKYPCERSELHTALRSEMTYVRLGDLQILLLPGELFPSLVYGGYRDKNHSAAGKSPAENPEPLIEIAGDDELLVFGVTNDMAGYVVPVNEFVLNPDRPYLDTATDRFGYRHYQETNSLGPLVGETLADAFRKMLSDVQNRTAAQ